jgi:hypothetical protein
MKMISQVTLGVLAAAIIAAIPACLKRANNRGSQVLALRESSALHMEYVSLCGPQADVPSASATTQKSALAIPHEAPVLAIFREHCQDCHGDSQSPLMIKDGQLDYSVLDRFIRFNASQGESARSTGLYRALTRQAGFMPQGGDRLNSKELSDIDLWITAYNKAKGGGVENSIFISDIDRAWCVAKDILAAHESQRPFLRYFTFAHLYNAGDATSDLEAMRVGLAKLLNSLSHGREIVNPVPVDPAGTILRIDLRDYDWTSDDWKSSVIASPYRTELGDSKILEIESYLKTRDFEIRGDWFIAAASRPPLYYQLTKTPATAMQLENWLGVDVPRNIRNGIAVRSGFRGSDAGSVGSGVSKNNRMIERHPSKFGTYWKSYDFKGNVGNKSLFERPLGPRGVFREEVAFDHDGGEMIYSLPNGLHGYMLVDGAGNRIDEGPIDVVFDRSNLSDPRIVNGGSCMKCHTSGIIEKADRIRSELYESTALDIDSRQAIERLYDPVDRKRNLTEFFRLDQEQYTQALVKTGAKVGQQDPVYASFDRFQRHADLAHVAAEFGLTIKEFVEAMRRFPGGVPTSWSSVLVEGGRIPRELIARDFHKISNGLGLRNAHPVDSLVLPEDRRSQPANAGSQSSGAYQPPAHSSEQPRRAHPEQPSQQAFCEWRTASGQKGCERLTQCGWSLVMNNGKGKCLFIDSHVCTDYENDENWCRYSTNASGRPCQFVKGRCQ